MNFNTFIYISHNNKRKNTMSAIQNIAAAAVVSEVSVQRKSIIIERLCALFGKSYDEIINAIQDEMTAMDLELQQWKLQVSEEPQNRAKPETKQKAKKEPAKPRAKKGTAAAAAAAAESNEAVVTVTTVDEAIVSEEVAMPVVLDEKKTKAPAKPRAKKSTDEAVATDDLEAKPKKAPAKPRAKKSTNDTAAAAAVIQSSEEKSDVVVADESATDSTNAKSKKAPAKPRAKKTESAATADAESTSQAKSKKAPAKPRAKKTEEVVVEAAAAVVSSATATATTVAPTPSITDIITASIESGASSQEDEEIEEVEVEVIEFVHEGVQYLRGKIDNKIYDPETSEIVGVWNEETSSIDEYKEEDDE
jgi:hypothetical protein